MLLSIFISDILPIFLIAGVGFVLARWMSDSVKTLSHVVFYALLPCLVFDLLVKSQPTERMFGSMALLAIAVVATMGLVAYAVATLLQLNRAELSAFVLVVMISNGGNYGLPVVLFAFGNEALAHASIFFVTSSILTNTLGVFVAAAGRRSKWDALQGVARIPTVYSVLAAVLILAVGVSVPNVILRPVGLLGDAALPMMMLVLGMQLEKASLPKRPSIALAAIALSLAVAPLVALGLTSILGISGPARQAGVLLAAMPVAVVTTILALEFDLAPAFVTSTVFLSTLLSPFTLTPLIAYLK